MSPLAQQDVAKNAEGAEKKGEERAIEIWIKPAAAACAGIDDSCVE